MMPQDVSWAYAATCTATYTTTKALFINVAATTPLTVYRVVHYGRVSSPQPQAPESLVRIHCLTNSSPPPQLLHLTHSFNVAPSPGLR